MTERPHPEHMRGQPRWFVAAGVPLIVGVAWLAFGWRGGFVAGVLASVPGVLLIATGCAMLLWPGDRQISHHMALASAASLPLALLLTPWLGGLATLLLATGAIAAFMVAGLAALFQNPLPRSVPAPDTNLKLARRIATDEALLGWFVNCAHIPRGETVIRDARELDALADVSRQRGWDSRPQTLHHAPQAPDDARLTPTRALGQRFEWLSFDSGFAVDDALPGAGRWHAHRANRRMRARVLRHPGRPRPWLICIHGYRMGLDWMDLSLFNIARLHRRLGLNLIMPILPLHGARRVARLSGGLFLDGPLPDLMHAQTQALWDIRRCMAWIREQQPASPIGTLGYSLGGYNAALLAAFEPELACVIAGIPLTDMPGVLWRHMPSLHLRFIETQGIARDRVADLLAPISPLRLAPRVPRDRRFIFAATADQLVPPEQALRLWQHWGRPEMHWYHGSHMSVRQARGVDAYIDNAFRQSGLTA